MIKAIQENLEEFKPRDKEELPALCASGNYVEKMKKEDRESVETRIKMFYLPIYVKWKKARKYPKTNETNCT